MARSLKNTLLHQFYFKRLAENSIKLTFYYKFEYFSAAALWFIIKQLSTPVAVTGKIVGEINLKGKN